MLIRRIRRNSPAWSAFDKTDLEKIRLVEFFDRGFFFGKRSGDQSDPSCRRGKGKGGKLKLNRPGRRPFAYDNIKLAGFHRRVEDFLNSFVQAVNFVNKK